MKQMGLYPAAPRTELMKLFDGLSQKSLLYIHAPAGYGKTFSARMWLERSGSVSAWIAVNESAGRKPVDFCERFTDTLCTLQPDNSELKEVMNHGSFAAAPFEFMERALKSFRSFASALAAKEKNEQKYNLAIDDLHLVTNADILKRLPAIISDLPENITVFILSRAEPPDSFSEFVVKNIMAVVEADNLKFSESEVKSFFAACGQKLSEKQADEVMAATNGWAIGLNALLLSGNREIGGGQILKYLETFIREQVWEKWSGERRDFMLRVSVAYELTPDFCNAMTGRKDSAEVLASLVRDNAFVSADKNGVYRFHHLFIEFLRNMLERDNKKLLNGLYKKAGEWFYGRKDYYKAVEYYMKCGDKKGISSGLKFMYNYNSPYASIEDTVSIIHMSVDGSITDDYPFLLETEAWAAYVEGRASDMENYIDRYFKQLPKIILQHPASAQTALLLRCMDYRNSLTDISNSLKNLPLKLFAQANTPSITQNMPLLHRSSRDYSEFMADMDKNFLKLRKTIGVLIGEEYDVMEDIVRAGLAYEQGNLHSAHELALSANAKLKDNFSPEVKFCAFMIIAAISDAQGNHETLQKILGAAEAMTEKHKAYYLNANMRAFLCRLKLNDGDSEAARDWLKYDAVTPYNDLSFYKLYQHFTTARAYIASGDYAGAVMFLKKLLILSEQYRRPLDITEINILLSIAYRKKGRSGDAFIALEQAVLSAQEYGYTQLFANEGAELSNMLHRFQKRILQKDYDGKISAGYVKNLYVAALTRAKHSKGLTGGTIPENLKFTDRQKEVMRYLCDGLTHNQIGEKMGLKHSAVKSHMILIYKKLDVSNGVDAMIKIKELDIL